MRWTREEELLIGGLNDILPYPKGWGILKKMEKEQKLKLLRENGLDDKRNEYGVKDQSSSYRIRNGILFRGFDVPTLEEANKEIVSVSMLATEKLMSSKKDLNNL